MQNQEIEKLLFWIINIATGVVEVLLKNKANPNPYSRNVDNVPPLILATVLEYTEIVKVLLMYNAEVDAVYGRDHLVPPLMYAIFAGHLELVKLLCDRVANIHFESTPKLDCGVSKFSTDELANALGNHKITDILKSPLQTESEENACDSDDLEEIHPTKKLTVDNTSSVRVFTKETQEQYFSTIINYVQYEYDSIYRDYRGHSLLTSSLLNRAYTNLSDLLPEVSDPVATVANPAKSLETEGLSTSNVYKILVSEASKWELIGVLLGIADGALQTIEADNSDSNKRVLEMVRIWLNMTDPPPTWKDLADTVEKLGNPKLSKEIFKKHARNEATD